MNTQMNLQRISVDRLKPAKYNPRKDLKPGDPAYEKLRRSLHEFGYVDPVIWNEVTGNIVGGHQRYKVLTAEGATEVDCVVVHIEKARRVIRFIECLKHTKGEFHGKPFKLLPWQEKIIRDVFGTVRDEEPSMRQYNQVYIEIGKKNGKSELGAALALNMLINDDEWKAEVYSCASDRQQAAIVFDVAVDMVRQNPTLSKLIKIIPSTKRMVYQPTGSIYQVLSSEVATKYGLNVSACIFDELHAQNTQAPLPLHRLPKSLRAGDLLRGAPKRMEP